MIHAGYMTIIVIYTGYPRVYFWGLQKRLRMVKEGVARTNRPEKIIWPHVEHKHPKMKIFKSDEIFHIVTFEKLCAQKFLQ